MLAYAPALAEAVRDGTPAAKTGPRERLKEDRRPQRVLRQGADDDARPHRLRVRYERAGRTFYSATAAGAARLKPAQLADAKRTAREWQRRNSETSPSTQTDIAIAAPPTPSDRRCLKSHLYGRYGSGPRRALAHIIGPLIVRVHHTGVVTAREAVMAVCAAVHSRPRMKTAPTKSACVKTTPAKSSPHERPPAAEMAATPTPRLHRGSSEKNNHGKSCKRRVDFPEG
jgi:hypothetical protein